jgi:phosphate transport system permease protein/phosphate transport system substrate-binding protein
MHFEKNRRRTRKIIITTTTTAGAVALAAAVAMATFLVLASSLLATTGANYAMAQSSVSINGAGATFPFPLIDTWRVEYAKQNPGVNINYQSIGSGGGIKQFTAMTVDFGASDAPLTAAQMQALKGTAVHIPETIGSVVAVYNLPEVPAKGLKLTGPVLADIFLGKITRWDDPKIKELNPDLQLPSKSITVVHRSDGSGTTFVWTSYLSKISPDWSNSVGKGTAVQWPTGIGSPGNEGVASSVKSTPYTMGYVELAYALTTKMPYAFLQNHDGSAFVEPSLESTKQAVEALATTLPKGEESWEDVSLLDAPGANSYPIASFSYILLYKDLSINPAINSKEKADALVRFVSWAVTDGGQQYSEKLSYVPLPDAVVQHNLETLRSLTYRNESLATAVVPEFSVVAAVLVLAVALVSAVAYQKLLRSGRPPTNLA